MSRKAAKTVLVVKMFPKRNTNVVFQFYFMYKKNQFAKKRNICEKKVYSSKGCQK